jgi:hypothetical protein
MGTIVMLYLPVQRADGGANQPKIKDELQSRSFFFVVKQFAL